MERDYADGVKSNVVFFIGTEVEHTPAHGMLTLFVVGIHDPKKIVDLAKENLCKHIFVGANQHFNPTRLAAETLLSVDEVMISWDEMIRPLLEQGLLVTLDFDVSHVELVINSGWCEFDNFIPQISIKIPHIKKLNYNTMLKIDDKDFNASNPGVWCHTLHNLMDRKVFTDWSQYGKDEPL